jgi:phage/plasmid-like protein (TIGR03299 family)
MSHGILQHDRPLFALCPAWHGLGNVLSYAPTLADADLLDQAGLNWRALESESIETTATVRTPTGPITVTSPAPEHKAIIRSDTHEVLGIVGRTYAPIQNTDLVTFARTISQSDATQVEAAGSLFNGRRVWFALRAPTVEIDGRDPIAPYILLTNRHDGRGSFIAKLTSIRVVCWNTLSLSLRDGQPTYKIRHTRNALSYAMEAAEVLGLMSEARTVLSEQAHYLSAQPLGSADLSKFFVRVFEHLHGPINPNPTTASEERTLNAATRAVATMTETATNERKELAYPDFNRWLAVNAASSWTQKNKMSSDAGTHFESQFFGSRDTRTTELFRMALA